MKMSFLDFTSSLKVSTEKRAATTVFMSTFVDNNRTDYGSGRDYNIVVDIHLGGR